MDLRPFPVKTVPAFNCSFHVPGKKNGRCLLMEKHSYQVPACTRKNPSQRECRIAIYYSSRERRI